MAQLTDDCFAFGGGLMPLEHALALLHTVPAVEGTETIPLLDADRRVLAADIIAPANLPPFDNAAVDGYAVRLADGSPLPVAGRLAAGAVPVPLQPGTAQRIFTGAAMPHGADTVFMQEDVQLRDGLVHLPPGLHRGANWRPAGEDIAAGARALPAGRRLRPQDLALAAALGITALRVRRRVRVALFSTGDELARPGAPMGPAHRHDSNRVLLGAMLVRAGAVVTDGGILPDRLDRVTAALRASAGHDLILTSGGVSAGEEDHVRNAVEQAGRLTFWRLAIKPGRPVALGDLQGAAFLGLPGNPAAAFVTFRMLALPLLAALAGHEAPIPATIQARAAFAHRKKSGRREFVRVRLVWDDGWTAHKHPIEGAGILTSLTETDGLAVLADDALRVEPGDALVVLLHES